MSQKFVCATCLISGRSRRSAARTASPRRPRAAPRRPPPRRRPAAAARRSSRGCRGRSAPGAARTSPARRAPARFPRRAGARTRRTPTMLPWHSEKCVRSVGVLPAPETPDLASMMMPRLEQPGRDERLQRQHRGGRIAARRTRRACASAQLVAIALRQAVAPRRPASAGRVRIPALPQRRVAQPERARQIEHARAARASAGADLGGRVSGHRQEHGVGLGRERSTSSGSTGASQISASAGTVASRGARRHRDPARRAPGCRASRRSSSTPVYRSPRDPDPDARIIIHPNV